MTVDRMGQQREFHDVANCFENRGRVGRLK